MKPGSKALVGLFAIGAIGIILYFVLKKYEAINDRTNDTIDNVTGRLTMPLTWFDNLLAKIGLGGQ